MKIRRWVVYLCISLAILGGFRILLMEWRTKQAEEVQAGDPPSASSKILNAIPSVESAVETIKHDIRRDAAKQKWMQRLNGPVEFYGRVLDQAGNPVAGAKLSLNLSRRVFEGTEAVVNERIELVSDFDGRFKLERPSGHSLRILDLTQDGYMWTYPPDVGSFDFSGYRSKRAPEHRSPTTAFSFHMWKKGAAEPVIRHSLRIRISSEREEFMLNLVTGELLEANAKPDLVIKFPHVPDAVRAARGERVFTFEVPDGGIVESRDTYPYAAPSGNYQSNWQWPFQPADTPPGAEGWKRSFYVKTRDGQVYAGLSVVLDFTSPALLFDVITNPSGSPVLEPDPEKQITDPEEIRRLDEATRVK